MGIDTHKSTDVLVVDDDDLFRLFINDTLANEGITVHQGRNGQEALEALAKGSYDLMLLDFKLPDMSGKDVLKSVRETSPSTDVVVITSYQDINLALDLLKLGAKEYVTKPIKPSDLVQRVRSAVRAHTAEQRLKQLQFEFSSRLLYDLRSPVNTIGSTIEYLKKDLGEVLPERQHLLFENIKSNIAQLHTLLGDMIDLTLLESGKVEIERLPTNLDEMLPSICERFRPQANAKDISIHLSTNGNVPTLELDAVKIDQVFSNLLDNAIKYTNSGGGIKLSLSVVHSPLNGRDRECVEINITDTGVGIPKEEIPLVFDKYKDMLIGKSSLKRTTGLGLAICRNIVEAHGGCVAVNSDLGKGSTFRVLLPVEAQ